MTFLDIGRSEYSRAIAAETRWRFAILALAVAAFFCGVGIVLGFPVLMAWRPDILYSVIAAMTGAAAMTAGALLILRVEASESAGQGLGGLILVAAGAALAIAATLYVAVTISDRWQPPAVDTPEPVKSLRSSYAESEL